MLNEVEVLTMQLLLKIFSKVDARVIIGYIFMTKPCADIRRGKKNVETSADVLLLEEIYWILIH